ncbi:ATP-binding cassette domain-containing protein [Rathayibacter sp. YIM 133350]|uniref:ABC transporter ATP-binding protein n=1 Tax=Rathayibacter sp. YIM 133350 TaxID=3131992 RepID=UPI00307CFD3A
MAGARVRADGWGWRHAGRLSWAVSELDLVIEPGERVLLLGSSGAGKSTLLAALAGVLGGDDEGEERGRLSVDGADPRAMHGRAGLVLQDPDSQVVLARVGDDVAFGCENLGVPREQIWQRVRESLAAVGLPPQLDRPTSMLSGGQKQRLALAGVLAMRPGLLLLDEPTANLDPQGVLEVRDAVVRGAAATNATLVVVEHHVEAWADHVDRVVVLSDTGGLLADGAPEEVLQRTADVLADAGVWVPSRPPALPARHPRRGTEPLLEATDLAVGRTPFASRRAVVAAHDLRFTLSAGRALAVTGANGSGKSTLALTVSGLLPPVAGRLEALPALSRGRGTQPHRWRARALAQRVGTVFQDPEHQFLTATVRAELHASVAVAADADAAGRRADELLEALGLGRLAGANPFTLSGGQKRRLSVATALVAAPQLLVLDEPTFGQDARTWAVLARLLAELIDEGAALLMVTHDGMLVDALADDRLVLVSEAEMASR